MSPNPRTPARKPPPRKSLLELAWPWIIRFVGVTIVIWETIIERVDRPSLLLLSAAMIGLPEFIRLERRDER